MGGGGYIVGARLIQKPILVVLSLQ